MDPDQFSKFRREAVRELMHLSELCEKNLHISSWPRWDYDLERGTLIFSEQEVLGNDSGRRNDFHFWRYVAMGWGWASSM